MAKAVREIERRSPRTKVAVVEMPPLENRQTNSERQIFNHTLTKEDILIIKTATVLNKMHLKGKVLNKDCFHLQEDAGKATAEQIMEAVQKIEPQEELTQAPTQRRVREVQESTKRKVSEAQDSMSWQIPSTAVGMVVGKGGKTVRDIEISYNVEIKIDRKEADKNKQTIIVKGPSTGVEKSTRKIEELTGKHREEEEKYHERKQKNRDQECEYFKRGECSFGNSCHFKHTPMQSTSQYPRSTSRDHSRRDYPRRDS